jgi:hypothetical protein
MQHKTRKQFQLTPVFLILAGVVVFVGSVLPYYTEDVYGGFSVSEDAITHFSFAPVIFALMILCYALACLRGWNKHWPHYLMSILSFIGIVYFTFFLRLLYEDAQIAHSFGADDTVGSGAFLLVTGLFISFLGSTIYIVRSLRTEQSCMTEQENEREEINQIAP